MSTVAAPPPEAALGGGTQTVGAYARAWWTDVKSGELGSLPIFVGLIIICIVFQTQNDRFLTAGNFVNLIVQTAPYAVIAMGVTFALLLGRDRPLDRLRVRCRRRADRDPADARRQRAADVHRRSSIVLGAGLAIGTFHGLIITKIGVPSFVVTLAGLLAWNGVVLLLIGSRGTVILQNDFVIGLANDFLAPEAAWVLAIASASRCTRRPARRARVKRRRAGLETDPTVIVGAAHRRPRGRAGDPRRGRQPGPRRCRTSRSWSAACS